MNLFAVYLQEINSIYHVQIVRVYGEEIERIEFPVPWAPKPPRRSTQKNSTDVRSNKDLHAISMHRLIRMPSNPRSEEIKAYDKKFKENPDSVKYSEINTYMDAVSAAEQHEIAKATIILCTCSTAGAPRLTRRFFQRRLNIQTVVTVLF